jgi:tetratricopeptide (TPR) repeat protein
MREVSVNLEKIGTLHALNQDTRDALRTFRKGLAIRRRLCRMDRSNAQWRHDLSVSLAKIGDILIEQADFAGALKAYHEGNEILSALRAEAPDNAAWRHAEHSIKSRIGDVLQQQDRIAEAAAVFQESLDVIRTLAEEAPGNREWRRDVSVGLSKLGDVLLRRRKRPDGRSAVSFYREALDVMQKLSAADPYNTAWEIEVVSLLWRLALAGDARRERASEAIAILHRLASQQRLGPEQREWIPMLESIRGRSRVART